MVRVELVREKIRRLRATLADLARVLPPDPSALKERDTIDLVAFRVYLVVQEMVDIASHVIADAGWGPAPSLREHFGILEHKAVIDGPLAKELSSAVKVRNVIAHAYVEVDVAKLHAAANELLPLGERYLRTRAVVGGGRKRHGRLKGWCSATERRDRGDNAGQPGASRSRRRGRRRSASSLPDQQAMLLRIMDGDYKRLGEPISRPCNVRVVAATNKPPIVEPITPMREIPIAVSAIVELRKRPRIAYSAATATAFGTIASSRFRVIVSRP